MNAPELIALTISSGLGHKIGRQRYARDQAGARQNDVIQANDWLQYNSGMLDESTWHSYRGSLTVIFSAPQTRAWWQNFGVERLYNAEFIAEVDELIRDQPVREQSQHLSVFN